MTEVVMQDYYWETVSSICCPECGHLFGDSVDTCPFCNDLQIYNCKDIKSLDQIDNNILFDDEKYFVEITFDDGL
jgi:hypothetical protein